MSDLNHLLREIQFKTISPELFDRIADETAESIADSKPKHNKPTQLRRFYDEIVMWHDKLKNNSDKYPEYIPFIKMLNAKVAYSKGRDHVDENYKKLMSHCLRQLDNEDVKTFFNFKLFMEAFMGFYKSYKR